MASGSFSKPRIRAWGTVSVVLGALGSAVLACSPEGGKTAAPPVVEGNADPAASLDPGVVPVDPIVAVTPMPPPAPVTDSSASVPDLLAGSSPDDSSATPVPVAEVRNGLADKQVSCPDGTSTTVSGTVYIPSGELPVYNATVYVPDADLKPLSQGASCGCEISGHPIATALTGADGHFTIDNVPVGDDIPLVVQVGKWRRTFKISTVAPCVDTPVPDKTLLLPSNQSQGDIPKIGVVTAVNDALECLVRKLGIDSEEFTGQRAGGRVQLFAGYYGADHYVASMNNGDPFPPSGALWANLESLQPYDLVLLSCDGQSEGPTNLSDKPLEARQAMFDYANMGGRLFASHFQEVWFKAGPDPFPKIAQFANASTHFDQLSAQIVSNFPKGAAMQDWATAVGASPTPGQIDIVGAERTIVQENTAYAQRWLASDDPSSVQYISANTPFGASDDQQCGRVVLSDIHVSPGRFPDPTTGDPGDDFSTPGTPFPEGCVTTSFSPQEKVLAFMLFDISNGVVPDSQAPSPPPVIH
jgi:hypothetical protein